MIGPGTRIRLSNNKDFFSAGKIQLRITKDPKTSEVIIPDGTDYGELAMIKSAVYTGDLLIAEGKEFVEKTPSYKWDGRVILQLGLRKLLPRLDKISKEEGAVEKLEELSSLEKEGRNDWGSPRSTVIKKIEELLSGIAGPGKVVDSDIESIEVTLVKQQ